MSHSISASVSLRRVAAEGLSPFPHGTGSLSLPIPYLGFEDGAPAADWGRPASAAVSTLRAAFAAAPPYFRGPVPALLPWLRGFHPLRQHIPMLSRGQRSAGTPDTSLIRFRSPLLAESPLISASLLLLRCFTWQSGWPLGGRIFSRGEQGTARHRRISEEFPPKAGATAEFFAVFAPRGNRGQASVECDPKFLGQNFVCPKVVASDRRGLSPGGGFALRPRSGPGGARYLKM